MRSFDTFNTSEKVGVIFCVVEDILRTMASKRKYNKTAKDLQLLVLKEILEAKPVLFGKFCSTLTKKDIQNKWNTVARLAASYGLIADDDGEKFRKTTWQNWRRNSMTKIDRIKKTGVGGADTDDLIDENDKMVLAIVGAEIAFGIGGEESFSNTEDNPQSSPKLPPLAQPHPQPSSSGVRAHQRSIPMPSSDRLIQQKETLLEITIYLKRLECREKEMLLGLPPSEYTENISSSTVVLSDDDDDS